MTISVIICTHNPCEAYLRRTLESLERQNLPKSQWELLLVDNASIKPLRDKWDLSWHPMSRHVREDELGLTPARLRGIREAVGKLVVFVDDDNLLADDYLTETLIIETKFSSLGAWGGEVRGEFEEEPQTWARPHLGSLAVRALARDYWSNQYSWDAAPCGAGLCVRKSVADFYAAQVQGDALRLELDRRGQRLTGCGDLDLAYTACDLGLGMGRFKKLRLLHIIPTARLQLSYLKKLFEGNGYSEVMLAAVRDAYKAPSRFTIIQKVGRALLSSRINRQLTLAHLKGARAAERNLAMARRTSLHRSFISK
jgi:hypothetical protein